MLPHDRRNTFRALSDDARRMHAIPRRIRRALRSRGNLAPRNHPASNRERPRSIIPTQSRLATRLEASPIRNCSLKRETSPRSSLAMGSSATIASSSSSRIASSSRRLTRRVSRSRRDSGHGAAGLSQGRTRIPVVVLGREGNRDRARISRLRSRCARSRTQNSPHSFNDHRPTGCVSMHEHGDVVARRLDLRLAIHSTSRCSCFPAEPPGCRSSFRALTPTFCTTRASPPPQRGLTSESRILIALPAEHNFPLACPGLLGALLTGARTLFTQSTKAADLANVNRA